MNKRRVSGYMVRGEAPPGHVECPHTQRPIVPQVAGDVWWCVDCDSRFLARQGLRDGQDRSPDALYWARISKRRAARLFRRSQKKRGIR